MFFLLDLRNKLSFSLNFIIAIDFVWILFEKLFDFNLSFASLFEYNFIFSQFDFIDNYVDLRVFIFNFRLFVDYAYYIHSKYQNYDFGFKHGDPKLLLFSKILLGFAFDFQHYCEQLQPVEAAFLIMVEISLQSHSFGFDFINC